MLEVLLVRMKLWSQVQVVKKSVFLKAYVYEAGVEAGHEFPDFTYVHVAYGKGEVSFLFLELYQVLVLHEGNRDFLGLYVYY